MEPLIQHAVESIHKTHSKFVLYITGGAIQTLSWLFSVPGGSNTILQCEIPYHRQAFLDITGIESRADLPPFSSPKAAILLAKAAYQRAVSLAPPGSRVHGIAATCALVSTPERRGTHRAHVATYSSDRIVEYQLILSKNLRNRWQEDHLTSRLALQAIFDACTAISTPEKTISQSLEKCGLDAIVLSQSSSMTLVRDKLSNGDILQGPIVSEHPDCIQAVISGELKFAECSRQIWNRDTKRATLIFPGSFNPIHYGHRRLMAIAREMYPDEEAAYEISVTNPDKPPLSAEVVKKRVEQFDSNENVIISRASLFSIKAQLYTKARFVIGVDTAIRIVAEKYYGGYVGMISELANLRACGCKFLVAGRLEQDKQGTKSKLFQNLDDVNIPAGFEDMFEKISESEFREDISSSEIRSSKTK